MDPPPPNRADQCRNWLELPRDVTASILRRLSVIDILTRAQMVCLLWRDICKDPSIWHAVDMGNLENPWYIPYDLEDMCRRAVDLSCGQLMAIKVGNFCTDDLLKYITESSTRLRYLGFLKCYRISDKGLSEAAAKIPLLEQLEISYCSLTKEYLKGVGSCCPVLKSLKLRSWVCSGDPYEECDEAALAIAENMPELSHLQLIGNKLSNDGLQAILDGCPRLESLELGYCFKVTLKGDLGRRCAEQIKDFRFHHFSDDEFEAILEKSGYYDEDNDYEEFGMDYIND